MMKDSGKGLVPHAIMQLSFLSVKFIVRIRINHFTPTINTTPTPPHISSSNLLYEHPGIFHH